MNNERLFLELELRWVRLLLASPSPKLAACLGPAARREEELRAALAEIAPGNPSSQNTRAPRRLKRAPSRPRGAPKKSCVDCKK